MINHCDSDGDPKDGEGVRKNVQNKQKQSTTQNIQTENEWNDYDDVYAVWHGICMAGCQNDFGRIVCASS